MPVDEQYRPEHEKVESVDHVITELAQDHTQAEEVEQESEDALDVDANELLRRAEAVDAVRDILQGRHPTVEALEALSARQHEALRVFQAIVDGRGRDGHFIYAERRLKQLNLVLADLQPLLAVGGMRGLSDSLIRVVDGLGQLRHDLQQLKEAQQGDFQGVMKKTKGEGDADDGDDGEGEGAGDDQPDDEVADQPKKSTVWDPDDGGDSSP